MLIVAVDDALRQRNEKETRATTKKNIARCRIVNVKVNKRMLKNVNLFVVALNHKLWQNDLHIDHTHPHQHASSLTPTISLFGLGLCCQRSEGLTVIIWPNIFRETR